MYFYCICIIRDVLLLLSTILYDLRVKYIHILGENVKKADIYTRVPVNMKTSLFFLVISQLFLN